MNTSSLNVLLRDFKSQISQHKKELVVFTCVFMVLIVNRYFSETSNLITLLDTIGFEAYKEKAYSWFVNSENSRFNSLLYWVGVLNFSYLVIPFLVIRFILKESIKNFGFSFFIERNFRVYYPIFMVFMLVLVFFASKTSAFQEKYPFYKIHESSQLYPRFLIWELLYCTQFFCLEFFFRGFMVKGLQHKFGLWSIVIMTIPYCMIHFGKPLPETIGSVFAGLILGYLSYKGKGIIPGFLMHITVALSMDVMALWQTNVL